MKQLNERQIRIADRIHTPHRAVVPLNLNAVKRYPPWLSQQVMAASSLAVTILCGLLASGSVAEPSSPFYAMDTAFAPHCRKSALSLDEGLALVKDLGYDGVAWHEKSPDEVQTDLAAIEKHGLRMFAIYSHAQVTPKGDVTFSAHAMSVMKLLRAHCNIFWIHISGKGPAFNTLHSQSPTVVQLRDLAETARANSVKVAVYPHMGDWTARFGDATRLARLVGHPNFGVSFNLCHSLAAGEEAQILALLEEAQPLLVTVTICGADSGVRANWARLIQPLGQGTFDVGTLLGKLREIGFVGPIGFQGWGIAGEPREILAPTIKAWQRLSVGPVNH